MKDSGSQGTEYNHDLELLEHAISQVAGGWENFWTLHGPYIQRIVSRFRLDHHSEDVVQEIAHSLVQNDFKKLKDWDPQRSSLRRYLTLISVSCTLNYIKSSKYRYQTLKLDSIDPATGGGESLGQFVDESADSPLERLERIQIVELLQGMLQEWVETEKIRPLDRDIVEYRLRGLTFKEIADVMGISLSQVTTRFTRVKPKLKKKLESVGIVR